MIETAATFIRTVRGLTFGKLLRLFAILLQHPLFAVLSFWATVKAFALAKNYFPETHSSFGIGNAFRHALWTSLIMSYCCKVSSPRKSKDWCLKITNFHEDIFPNEPLQRFMDLHNNQVGIDYFFEQLTSIHRQFFETSFLIDGLLEKTKTAKILINLEQPTGEELVYITSPFS